MASVVELESVVPHEWAIPVEVFLGEDAATLADIRHYCPGDIPLVEDLRALSADGL